MENKKLFDDKCKLRVSDFEKSQANTAKRGFKVAFNEFKYYDSTLFVWNVIGVVFKGSQKIRVEWDYAGCAFIGAERVSEFDLYM